MTRSRRPGIFQVGRVYDDGHAIVVSGWGLNHCTAGCHCHVPLAIDDTLEPGLLGLTKAHRCDCCQPWSPDELAAIGDFLAHIRAIPETRTHA